MPFRLSIPLPGPVSYSKSLGGNANGKDTGFALGFIILVSIPIAIIWAVVTFIVANIVPTLVLLGIIGFSFAVGRLDDWNRTRRGLPLRRTNWQRERMERQSVGKHRA